MEDGTNSTMTMLKEIFKDEPADMVTFCPACASGPLGGDAELVALMVGGRIGGISFFQDPISAVPRPIEPILIAWSAHITVQYESI